MTPLTKYTIEDGESLVVGTAYFLAADVEAVLNDASNALEYARDYINGWTGCVPPEDARSKQWREFKEVNQEITQALDRLKGMP